ncbi:MAG: glycosyltransferase [Proteobacteria bacterium]|nr:glycosyltransferase [Pseudomonadota bacterium]
MNKSHLPRVNNLRKENALPEAKDIMLDVWPSKLMNLIGVSPVFCKKQKDWGQNHQVCGFLNLPQNSDNEKLPYSLKQFLNTGEPPVYMNFGSMMPLKSEDRKIIYELFKETAKLANCRIILQIDESEQDLYKSDSKTYYTPPVNHLKVFPYCSAIVHHGGAGTTQSATLSGVPSIVVSFMVDQAFWGTELKRIGIAPEAIPFKKLTPKKLANKVKYVLNSPHMKEKANEIGKEIKKEDSVKRAVKLIGELINDRFNK